MNVDMMPCQDITDLLQHQYIPLDNPTAGSEPHETNVVTETLQQRTEIFDPYQNTPEHATYHWMSAMAPNQCPISFESEVAYGEGYPLVYGTFVEPEPRVHYEATFGDFSGVGVVPPVAYVPVPSYYYKGHRAGATRRVAHGGVRKVKAQVVSKKPTRGIRGGRGSRSSGSMSEEEREKDLIRRNSACVRERGRMAQLNLGFDRLRGVLPCIKPPDKKLSKIETLTLSIKYIMHLENLKNAPPGSVPTVEDCALGYCEGKVWAPAPNYYNCIKNEMQPPTSFYNPYIETAPSNEFYWQAEANQSFVYRGNATQNRKNSYVKRRKL